MKSQLDKTDSSLDLRLEAVADGAGALITQTGAVVGRLEAEDRTGAGAGGVWCAGLLDRPGEVAGRAVTTAGGRAGVATAGGDGTAEVGRADAVEELHTTGTRGATGTAAIPE